VIAHLQLCPNTYHTYVDLNKAFNSPIHSALWRLMEHQNFPSSSISLLRFLYAHPRDIPLLNGVPSSPYIPQRGLRQGCPLSPTLFAIYLDPVLRLLHARISASPSSQLYAFADDLLLQSPHPAAHGRLLKTLHSDAKAWGLEINPRKTVIHAMGAAPPLTITFHDDPHLQLRHPRLPRTLQVSRLIHIHNNAVDITPTAPAE
jgi:hypothetical protein